MHVEIVVKGRSRRAWWYLILAFAVVAIAQIAGLGAGQMARWLVASPPPAASGAAMVGPTALAAGARLPTPMILGYYDGGGVGSLGYQDMVHDVHALSGIVPDWFEIWSEGQITGTADPGVMAYARLHHLWTFALVQQNQDPAVFHTLLNTPAYAAAAQRHMLSLVERDGFDGINLDFEGVQASDRAALTRFVQQLSALFHAHGYYVTLSVPAETSNQPQNGWTGAYDYRALGKVADLVMPMAYDDHWAGGPPGGVAPAAWVASVARYAVSTMPASKVVLGVPAYGYNWGGSSTASALSYFQAVTLDDAYARGRAGSHFAYTAGGVTHQVFFEDAQTFQAKAQVAVDYKLRGIALWRLGIEDPAIWSIMAR